MLERIHLAGFYNLRFFGYSLRPCPGRAGILYRFVTLKIVTLKIFAMATHRSAEKRHRQSLKRRARNRLAKSTIRTTMKNALVLAKSGKADEAKAQAQAATRLIDKAAVHGILHKKNAQRNISRLNARVNALVAGK
jgi:small subunit ribosomal protein S20